MVSCDKKEMITGEHLQAGDVLIGMASTGVHSNGFSLVRKVFEKELTREGLDTYYDELWARPWARRFWLRPEFM